MSYRRPLRPHRSSGSNHPTKESTNMKKFGFATIAASGLAAAILGLAAPADAAPTGPGNAQDTVNALQAEGYHVIVNKLGSAPLTSPRSSPSGPARPTHAPTPVSPEPATLW